MNECLMRNALSARPMYISMGNTALDVCFNVKKMMYILKKMILSLVMKTHSANNWSTHGNSNGATFPPLTVLADETKLKM